MHRLFTKALILLFLASSFHVRGAVVFYKGSGLDNRIGDGQSTRLAKRFIFAADNDTGDAYLFSAYTFQGVKLYTEAKLSSFLVGTANSSNAAYTYFLKAGSPITETNILLVSTSIIGKNSSVQIADGIQALIPRAVSYATTVLAQGATEPNLTQEHGTLTLDLKDTKAANSKGLTLDAFVADLESVFAQQGYTRQ